MRAAIYTRLSKDHTGEGLGVERQLQDCRKLADARGWTVSHEICDNSVSATKGVRPGFTKLLALMQAHEVDAVVVWHVDRLCRRMTDLEAVIDTGVQVATVTGDMDLTTDTGRMVGRILASVARAEVERKGARQQRANLQRAEQGLPHVTHRPFGYEADCMTIRPDEAEVLHLMAKLVLAGNSYQETAWQLNERGYRTSRCDKFFRLTVRKLIQCKRYAGIRTYQGVDYPAQWPAIWDDDTWQQLQLVVRLRKDSASGQAVGRKFLLTGLLWCGECGNMLTGVTEKHSRTRQVHRAYRCFRLGSTERQGGCGKIYRNADHLETYLRELVLYRLDSPALAKLLQGGVQSEPLLSQLLDFRQQQVNRIDSLVDDYSTALLTRQEFARGKAKAQAELERIEQEIGRLTARSASIDIPLNETLAEAWQSHRQEWQRRLLDLVIERVVINQGNSNVMCDLGNKRVRFNKDLVSIAWLA